MAEGNVVFFNEQRGFGFIKPEEGNKDIFVHYTGIANNGFKTLYDGQRVTFDIQQGERGPIAVNVTAISETGGY